jgi:glycosyltransferase involved in cell wall biosynthesis
MAGKHIVHVFSTFAPGGPQRRTADILNHVAGPFRHTILSTDNVLTARELLRPDVPVQFAEVAKDARGRVRLAALRRQLRALSPDLIITYNWGATDAIRAIGLRRFCTILHAQDGFGPEEAKHQIPRRLWMRRLFYRLAEAVVVPSRSLERIARETWWLPPRRVLYIPNGIDLGRYSEGDADGRRRFRMQYSVPEESPVVGMVAHLRGEKNPARLLRAFAAKAPRNAVLAFVGDGPLRGELSWLAESLKLGDRIRFCGHLASPAAAYAGFDVFALSSDTEQMPVSVLEAMACALPVLATDVGDIAEMVAPPNRPFITSLGDDAAYGAALERLCADGALRRQLGAANRGRCIAQFSLEQQNNAYRDLYDLFAAPRRLVWRSEHFRT